MSILDGAETQYIDANGKLRGVTFSDGLMFVSPPLPPLNIPISDEINEIDIETAIAFIEQHEWAIYEQTGDSNGITGIWISPRTEGAIGYGYIPLKLSLPVKGVGFSPVERLNPLKKSIGAEAKLSELARFRRAKKVAGFLKQYVLFTYARDPENFGEDSFAIVPDYQYRIEKLNKRLFFDKNSVMYKSGKLIVPSEETKSRLLAYLKVSLLNDKEGVLRLATTNTLQDYYHTLADFRRGETENQYIFLSRNGVMRWKENVSNMHKAEKISDALNPNSVQPYFYKNPAIHRNKLILVQNVKKHDLKAALTTALKWNKDRVNIGYNPDVDEEVINKLSYTVFASDGTTEKVGSATDHAYVLNYGGSSYAALLLFD